MVTEVTEILLAKVEKNLALSCSSLCVVIVSD